VGKFQAFVHSRPTDQLGGDEVRGFLTELAVRYGVAAATQNQAFNALLFFYRHVLHREFGQLDGVVRAKHHRYVPVVLSHAETEAILGELQPPYRLVGLLLYGCGWRAGQAPEQSADSQRAGPALHPGTVHGNSLLRPGRRRLTNPPKRGRVIHRLRTRVPGTTI
jgi:hypothetical protein